MNMTAQQPNSSTTRQLDDDVVLSVRNVSKKFCKRLRRSMAYGIADLSKNLVGIRPDSGRLRKDEFWAVDGISFELRRGEVLGLIGPNGSGKTTVLRLVAGIFPPDKGRIAVRGRLGSLIAVGAGFHPYMTGRENTYLNGAILGMSRREIDERFNDIVDFAEIGDFIDSPVSTYSSGMRVRLGYAVAVHLEPDVMLVDEILAVGDRRFQVKCHRHMAKLRDNRKAIILVSHNVNVVRNVCDRAIVLWKARLAQIGPANDVVDWYIDRCDKEAQERGQGDRSGGGNNIRTEEGEITNVEILDTSGQPANTFSVGESLTLRVTMYATKRIENPCIYVGFRHTQEMGCPAAGFQNHEDKVVTVLETGKNIFELRIDALYLRGGTYCANICIHKSDRHTIVAWRREQDWLSIEAPIRTNSTAYLPHRWYFRRLAAP